VRLDRFEKCRLFFMAQWIHAFPLAPHLHESSRPDCRVMLHDPVLDTVGMFTTIDIDIPGLLESGVLSINDAGQIVGTFHNANGFHGFLATPASIPEPATWLLLGSGLIALVFWRRRSLRQARSI
jgi:hypothetical protein